MMIPDSQTTNVQHIPATQLQADGTAKVRKTPFIDLYDREKFKEAVDSHPHAKPADLSTAFWHLGGDPAVFELLYDELLEA